LASSTPGGVSIYEIFGSETKKAIATGDRAVESKSNRSCLTKGALSEALSTTDGDADWYTWELILSVSLFAITPLDNTQLIPTSIKYIAYNVYYLAAHL
jgi:hypothetical protein